MSWTLPRITGHPDSAGTHLIFSNIVTEDDLKYLTNLLEEVV